MPQNALSPRIGDGHAAEVTALHITISVHDRVHLARVLRRLRHNNDVIRVVRRRPRHTMPTI